MNKNKEIRVNENILKHMLCYCFIVFCQQNILELDLILKLKFFVHFMTSDVWYCRVFLNPLAFYLWICMCVCRAPYTQKYVLEYSCFVGTENFNGRML